MITPVILCGGSGTRLWPLSRKNYPKQFSSLIGTETLFQASVKRMSGPGFAAPIIVTGSDFRFIVAEQMMSAGVDPGSILIEPSGKNTAPAVLAAALVLAETDPSALMLVGPSDHVIADAAAFRAMVEAARPAAEAGQLVTFGITPTRPETGYGYLALEEATGPEVVQKLKGFVEKPNEERAAELLASGTHLWNAGIFLFSVPAILAAFEAHAPGLLGPVRAAVEAKQADLGFCRIDPEAWKLVESISIDYAIMEHASNLSVVRFSGSWSDLGDWDSVWRASPQDDAGNTFSGAARAIECENTLLRADSDGQQLFGIGLKNIVVVAMGDAVLVADKSRAQDVKAAVAILKAEKVPQAVQFPKDHRPWGWFESLVVGGRFQVKRIHVHPGAALSLQSHHHRSEHWIVVEGTARVTIDKEVQLVTENQSVYIPLGVKHRMENPGKLPMVLIEVQTGSYVGEDDIVRYEDIYARGQGAKG
jgi:mannose-1-phosphate guanylyltransferase/mannose-6-phosphate isomerase